MLTPVSQVASEGKFIFASASTNTTVYTVPAGKSFTGRFITSGNAEIYINGRQFYVTQSSIPSQFPFEFTFGAGTVISCGSSYAAWSVVGIEK